MMIHVLQGERELISDCRSLARFELRGIPAMVAGAAKIRVTFEVDADGLLSVAARELGSGVEASIQVKPSYGLTDGEIARMLKDSFEHAGSDKQARQLREHQVDGERLLEAVQGAWTPTVSACSAVTSATPSNSRCKNYVICWPAPMALPSSNRPSVCRR